MQHFKTYIPKNVKTAGPIITRTAVFLVCFVIISAILGPRIISHGLVGKDGFQIYGGAGKSLLFGSVAFLILILRNETYPKLKSWRYTSNLPWLVGALAFTLTAWTSINKLLQTKPNLLWPIAAHASILALVLSLLIFSFGMANLRALVSVYAKELKISLALTIIFFGFLYLTYGLWGVLASMVLACVRWLLDLVGVHAAFVPPRTLLLGKFGISIEEYCSGIDSIALFTALYVLIGILDWGRFNHRKYVAVFIPALIILFGFNIVRVFGLILGGYYINPHIAFSLFHTYAGMVLFIVYSALFWMITYRWMLVHQEPRRQQ